MVLFAVARPKITTRLARSTANDRTSSALSAYAKELSVYAKELPCRVRNWQIGDMMRRSADISLGTKADIPLRIADLCASRMSQLRHNQL